MLKVEWRRLLLQWWRCWKDSYQRRRGQGGRRGNTDLEREEQPTDNNLQLWQFGVMYALDSTITLLALNMNACLCVHSGVWVFSEKALGVFLANILSCHSRESAGVINNMTKGCIRCPRSSALVLCMLAYWHGLLGHWNGMEPSLMILLTPVLILLRQVEKVFLNAGLLPGVLRSGVWVIHKEK